MKFFSLSQTDRANIQIPWRGSTMGLPDAGRSSRHWFFGMKVRLNFVRAAQQVHQVLPDEVTNEG